MDNGRRPNEYRIVIVLGLRFWQIENHLPRVSPPLLLRSNGTFPRMAANLSLSFRILDVVRVCNRDEGKLWQLPGLQNGGYYCVNGWVFYIHYVGEFSIRGGAFMKLFGERGYRRGILVVTRVKNNRTSESLKQ